MFSPSFCHFEKNTVELQWLKYLWNHENMFETGVVRANECYSLRQVRRHNRDIFSIFFNKKVCCMLSLESYHRGDSNECTQYTIFNVEKRNSPLIIPNLQLWDFFKGLKNEFETAWLNEPSVSEPLKVFCTYM